MKKLFVFIIITTLLLSISLLFSCNSENTKTENPVNQEEAAAVPAEQEAAVEDRNALDDLGEFDFKSYEYKICQRVNRDYTNSFLDFAELTGDVYEDAVFMRNRKLEDRFNITITVIEREFDQLISIVRSGVDDYDLYTIRGAEVFSFAQEGLINSIKDLPHIDLSKTYWDDFITNQLTVANKKYFAVGAFEFSSYDYAYALVFNKQLIQNYGLENPFDLVKSGKWTFDKFTEMAKAGTFELNGDGKMDERDAWGYIARSHDVLPGFWVGANVKAAEKDKDDLPYNTMGSEKFINVIDKIFDIIHGNDIYYNSFGPSIFADGNVLFNDITLHQLKNLRAMETDFGILPYPKFDEIQKEYYTRLGGNTLFCTVKAASKEDLERTSVILEAMASESLKTCVPAYYDLMLKTKLARDVESEEIIDSIVTHRVVDFVDNLWVAEIRDGPLNDMFLKKNNTLVSLNEKLESIFNKKRDSMVEAFLELAD